MLGTTLSQRKTVQNSVAARPGLYLKGEDHMSQGDIRRHGSGCR